LKELCLFRKLPSPPFEEEVAGKGVRLTNNLKETTND